MSPGLHTSSLNNEEVSPGVRSELESRSRRFQPLSLTPNDHFLPLPSSCWAQHLFGHSMRKREEGRDREDTTKHARPLSSFLSSTAVWLVLRCLSRFLARARGTWKRDGPRKVNTRPAQGKIGTQDPIPVFTFGPSALFLARARTEKERRTRKERT